MKKIISSQSKGLLKSISYISTDKKLLTPAIGLQSKNIYEDLRILSNKEIPLIPRISEDKIIIDVRSCPVEDDEKIIELLNKL